MARGRDQFNIFRLKKRGKGKEKDREREREKERIELRSKV